LQYPVCVINRDILLHLNGLRFWNLMRKHGYNLYSVVTKVG